MENFQAKSGDQTNSSWTVLIALGLWAEIWNLFFHQGGQF